MFTKLTKTVALFGLAVAIGGAAFSASASAGYMTQCWRCVGGMCCY